MMDGILVIDKPEGPTSHDVVMEVKGLLEAEKVGHLGTLDPAASGVLPLVVNKATKLSSRFSHTYKVYEFDLILGASTDTDDEEGKIIKRGCLTDNALDMFNNVLPSFLGEIVQVPPAYSAKKVRGVPLYRIARQGEKVDVSPRKIKIYSLDILKPGSKDGTLRVRLRMVCSKGTYVRALCRDIGKNLGFFGHAGMIRRVKSGPFDISEAVSLDKFKEMTPEMRKKLVI